MWSHAVLEVDISVIFKAVGFKCNFLTSRRYFRVILILYGEANRLINCSFFFLLLHYICELCIVLIVIFFSDFICMWFSELLDLERPPISNKTCMLSFNNKYVATITAFYAGYINVILNTLWKLIDFESYNKYKKNKNFSTS